MFYVNSNVKYTREQRIYFIKSQIKTNSRS